MGIFIAIHSYRVPRENEKRFWKGTEGSLFGGYKDEGISTHTMFCYDRVLFHR